MSTSSSPAAAPHTSVQIEMRPAAGAGQVAPRQTAGVPSSRAAVCKTIMRKVLLAGGLLAGISVLAAATGAGGVEGLKQLGKIVNLPNFLTGSNAGDDFDLALQNTCGGVIVGAAAGLVSLLFDPSKITKRKLTNVMILSALISSPVGVLLDKYLESLTNGAFLTTPGVHMSFQESGLATSAGMLPVVVLRILLGCLCR